MKTLVMILSLAFSFPAMAELADFNALINENQQAQKTFHQGLKTAVEDTRLALESEERGPIVIESQAQSVHSPTDKRFLRFKKELVNHQAPQKELRERLASEFESVDLEF